MSLTKDALDYMAKTKCTAYVAAEKFGISASTIYAAARKKRCPHCGNFIKPKKSKSAQSELKVEKASLTDEKPLLEI